ncbi:MAG: hypothetical protein WCP92_08980 [bacterium]
MVDPEACNRYGVTCTGTDGAVQTKASKIERSRNYLESIDLSDNNLSGKLPSTIDLLLPYIAGVFDINKSAEVGTKLIARSEVNTKEFVKVVADLPTKEVINTADQEVARLVKGEIMDMPTKEAKTISENIINIFQSSVINKSATSQDILLRRSLSNMTKLQCTEIYRGSRFSPYRCQLYHILPFLHFTTLDLSHNHIEGRIPQ